MKTYGVIGLPRKRRAHPEADIQAAIAAYLDNVICKPAYCTAIGHGMFSTVTQGRLFKRMGVKPGQPDFHIYHDRKTYAMEIKSATGVLSETQKEAHARLRLAGVSVEVVRSIDDVQALLAGKWYSIPTRERRPTPVDALSRSLAREG